MYTLQVDTPLGKLQLAASDKGIIGLDIGETNTPSSSSPILEEAARQLEEWFKGERRDFDLPLDLQGTEFQRAVWAKLQAIPWGQYRTYGDIAQELGIKNGARAVGGACGANPTLIIIPCHRILASTGKLGGFSSGLEVKRRLLGLEGISWRE